MQPLEKEQQRASAVHLMALALLNSAQGALDMMAEATDGFPW